MAGSSLHVHTSLQDADGVPQFPGNTSLAGTPVHASDTFRWFLGGLLTHVREFTCFLAPNPNSYKRYRPGTFAPTGIAWSWDNRTAGLRIIGSGAGLRIECRMPGADANPYLTYAALLAAGIAGIEGQIDPGPAYAGDLYGARELPQIPHSLGEAIAALEASGLAREAFGDSVIEHYLHFARTELGVFETRVSDVERERYFERG